MAINLKKRNKVDLDFINAAPQKVTVSAAPTQSSGAKKSLSLEWDQELSEMVKYLKAHYKLTARELCIRAITYAINNEDKIPFRELQLVHAPMKRYVQIPEDYHIKLKELANKYHITLIDANRKILKAYIKTLKIKFP